MIFFAFVIISLGYVSSIGVSYCCEKTTDGAWCQNVDSKDKCATGNGLSAPAPTSCESTAYCKLGTCINSQKGECMENTPQQKCQQSGGLWDVRAPDAIPQCKLGCCLIGDQAAFTTQTSCKQLSSLYGLETNYRTDITNEVECIASANSDDKGACVFEQDSSKTCKFLTQKECNALNSQVSNVSFHKDFLCSAEELGTNCGPSLKKSTTCVEGEDAVYFVDTCGNLANIYDATKINDKLYWTKIVQKADSCGASSKTGNAGSATCGNCDYYSGSTCENYDRQKDARSPQYGDNVCRDLSCTYQGQKYQHGETWCADSGGISKITADEKGNLLSATGQDLPGGEYTRLVCYNGEVTAEPCAEFRQEVCVQSEVNGFKNAACKKNYWEQCLKTDNQDDCENPELGDCKWINSGELKADLSDDDKEDLNKIIKSLPGQNTNDALKSGDIQGGINRYIGLSGKMPYVNPVSGILSTITTKFNEEKYFQFACVPKYAPGYNLNPQTDLEAGKTQASCALATSSCTIVYSDSVLGRTSRTKDDCDPKKGNCQCLPEDGPWLLYRANMCQSLGDCGYKVSYQGTASDQTNWWDFIWRSAYQDA